MPATVATSLSQSAYTPTPVVHSAATTKGSLTAMKPNTTKEGKCDMQCEYLSKVTKVCMQGVVVSRIELVVRLHPSVGSAAFDNILSISDEFSSVMDFLLC